MAWFKKEAAPVVDFESIMLEVYKQLLNGAVLEYNNTHGRDDRYGQMRIEHIPSYGSFNFIHVFIKDSSVANGSVLEIKTYSKNPSEDGLQVKYSAMGLCTETDMQTLDNTGKGVNYSDVKVVTGIKDKLAQIIRDFVPKVIQMENELEALAPNVDDKVTIDFKKVEPPISPEENKIESYTKRYNLVRKKILSEGALEILGFKRVHFEFISGESVEDLARQGDELLEEHNSGSFIILELDSNRFLFYPYFRHKTVTDQKAFKFFKGFFGGEFKSVVRPAIFIKKGDKYEFSEQGVLEI